MITKDSQSMLELFRHYKDGNLAVSGGVLEQPAKYLESMNVIERCINSGQ
jgi:hypothetical protein